MPDILSRPWALAGSLLTSLSAQQLGRNQGWDLEALQRSSQDGNTQVFEKEDTKIFPRPVSFPHFPRNAGRPPAPTLAWGVTSDCGGKALGTVSPAASVTILKYCWDRGPQVPLMPNVSCTLLPGDQSIKQQTQPDYSPAWGPPETPTPSLPGRLLEIDHIICK